MFVSLDINFWNYPHKYDIKHNIIENMRLTPNFNWMEKM